MIRLHVIAEGQTEEEFINSVLGPHLCTFEIYANARCVETSRKRRIYSGRDLTKINRGGLLQYEKAKNDLLRWMREDQKCDSFFTTMLDLYAIPCDFPGFADAAKKTNPYERVSIIEEAFEANIQTIRDDPRFIPYIQLHEFEALLLSDPGKFKFRFSGCEQAIQKLVELSDQFDSPELINDGNETAPSKRIIELIPEYKGVKASAGPLIAKYIGLPKILEKCTHFSEWVEKLKALRPINIS